jgi:hypothetical protein
LRAGLAGDWGIYKFIKTKRKDEQTYLQISILTGHDRGIWSQIRIHSRTRRTFGTRRGRTIRRHWHLRRVENTFVAVHDRDAAALKIIIFLQKI